MSFTKNITINQLPLAMNQLGNFMTAVLDQTALESCRLGQKVAQGRIRETNAIWHGTLLSRIQIEKGVEKGYKLIAATEYALEIEANKPSPRFKEVDGRLQSWFKDKTGRHMKIGQRVEIGRPNLYNPDSADSLFAKHPEGARFMEHAFINITQELPTNFEKSVRIYENILRGAI